MAGGLRESIKVGRGVYGNQYNRFFPPLKRQAQERSQHVLSRCCVSTLLVNLYFLFVSAWLTPAVLPRARITRSWCESHAERYQCAELCDKPFRILERQIVVWDGLRKSKPACVKFA